MGTVDREVTCTQCGGSGKYSCYMCKGSGLSPLVVYDQQNRPTPRQPCPTCQGTGRADCQICNGTGVVASFQEVTPIAPFVSSRFPGSGAVNTGGRQSAGMRDRGAASDAADPIDSRLLTIMVIVLVVLAILLVISFTVEQILVAAEGFAIFAGWSAIRVANLSSAQESRTLEGFRVTMAIIAALAGGSLVAYLLLFTDQGLAITNWVTAQHIRIAGSLFGVVLGLSVLEFGWRALERLIIR